MSSDDITPESHEPARSRVRSSIVWKLTGFVGVTVALVGGMLILAAYLATASILQDQIRERLTTIAADRQEILTKILRERGEQAGQLAKRARVRQLLAQHADGTVDPRRFELEAQAVLGAARGAVPGTLAVWLEDPQGHRLAAIGPEPAIEPFTTAPRPDSSTDGGPAAAPRRLGDSYAAPFRALVRGAEGRVLGAVMIVADFGPTLEFLIDPHGMGETGEVLVGIAQDSTILLLAPPRLGPRVIAIPPNGLAPLDAAIAGQFGFMRTQDYRGREVLAAYRPAGLDRAPWGLVAKIDADEADEPVTHLRRLLLILGGFALMLGLAASNLVARQFSRPIRRLARTAKAVAAGDLAVRSEITSNDEIGALGLAFNRMTEELARSHADLEARIHERTRELEAVRDLLDAFFRISTSQLDPHNIDKTFDSVLRFCAQLGYDLAMISLVDREAGVIRAVRAAGAMTEIIQETVRALDSGDVLAIVVREGRSLFIPDSRLDPRCDQAAIERSRIRGQFIVPLVSDQVLGVLQVASHAPLEPDRVDPRPLETLASHTARALAGLRQLEEIRRLNQSLEEHAQELARGQAALREQTQILQSILDCMGDGLVVSDDQGRFMVFNPAAQRLLGRGATPDPYQFWSRTYDIFLADRQTPFPSEDLPLARAIRGESVDQAELYIAYPSKDDGTWITVTGRPLRDESGALKGGVVAFHDISRRKKADRRQAAQYETTRALSEVDSPGDAYERILEILCRNLDWDRGAFWRVDPHAKRLRRGTLWSTEGPNQDHAEPPTPTSLAPGEGLPGLAWSEGRPVWIPDLAAHPNLTPAGDPTLADRQAAFALPILLRGDCLGVIELSCRRPRDPDHDLIEMAASLATQIGQFIDRREMRTRVFQAEKLASLGMLSAGVAHEINNPLAYVVNNLAVFERDVRFLFTLLDLYAAGDDLLSDQRPGLLNEISQIANEFDLKYVHENMGKLIGSTRQGIKRVADIVENLRGFARLDRASVDQASVHEAIASAVEMIRGRLERRGVVLDQRGDPLPLIPGSPTQLNQVFLNLLVNALQAIEAAGRDQGRITITTAARPGEVAVDIADNGCGIPEDVLPQIFDPFFTTKGVGDGTGLGLSITHGMVQDHGGRLEVESTPGQGALFRVILPTSRSAL